MATVTKASFYGLVKKNSSLNWMDGFVNIDTDADCQHWFAKLYLKSKPNQVFYRVKIQEKTMKLKVGRLMIENKKGDGIHIKLYEKDLTPAQNLIKKVDLEVSKRKTIKSDSFERSGCEIMNPAENLSKKTIYISPEKPFFLRNDEKGTKATVAVTSKKFYGTSPHSFLQESGKKHIENFKKSNISTPVSIKRIKPRNFSPPNSSTVVSGADISREKKESHSPKSHSIGFDNLGNSCFMNSPLQCLSSLEPFSIDIQTAMTLYGQYFKADSITRMLYFLMKDMRRSNSCPMRIKNILIQLRSTINGKFKLNTQQDAHELLTEILDRTQEEIKAVLKLLSSNVKENAQQETRIPSISSPEIPHLLNPVDANFKWFYKESSCCKVCGTNTPFVKSDDTILILPLNPKRDSSVQDCVDQYFSQSELERECVKCGKTELAVSTRQITQRPRIFILMLLRYQHQENFQFKKILDSISIPSYINVNDFCQENVKPPPYLQIDFMLDRFTKKTIPNTIKKSVDIDIKNGAKSNRRILTQNVQNTNELFINQNHFEIILDDVLVQFDEKKIISEASKKGTAHFQLFAAVNYYAREFLSFYDSKCDLKTEAREYTKGPNVTKLILPHWAFPPRLTSVSEGLAICYQPQNCQHMCLLMLEDLVSMNCKKDEVTYSLIDMIFKNVYKILNYTDLEDLVLDLALTLAIAELKTNSQDFEGYGFKGSIDKIVQPAMLSGKFLKQDNSSYGIDGNVDGQDTFKNIDKTVEKCYNAKLRKHCLEEEDSSGEADFLSSETKNAVNEMDPLKLGKSMDEYSEKEISKIDLKSLSEDAQLEYVIAKSKYETHRESQVLGSQSTEAINRSLFHKKSNVSFAKRKILSHLDYEEPLPKKVLPKFEIGSVTINNSTEPDRKGCDVYSLESENADHAVPNLSNSIKIIESSIHNAPIIARNFVKKDFSRLKSPISPRKKPFSTTLKSTQFKHPKSDGIKSKMPENSKDKSLNTNDLSFVSSNFEIEEPSMFSDSSKSPVSSTPFCHKRDDVEMLTKNQFGSPSISISSSPAKDSTEYCSKQIKTNFTENQKARRSLFEAFSSPEEKENKFNINKNLSQKKRTEYIESGNISSSYRLIGIVNHLGNSPNIGHYVSYCYNLYKRRWFHLDDKYTRETNENNAQSDSVTNGYVFFYMDKDLFDKYEEKVPLVE